MKLVIFTQIYENYGDAVRPYWKPKGGFTYEARNLTPVQVRKIKASGIPTLTDLIVTKNDGYREEIIDFSVEEDDFGTEDPHQSPVILTYENDEWVATEHQYNDEYGWMRKEIAKKTARYVMQPGGNRKDYTCFYEMRDGTICNSQEELSEYLSANF